MATHAKCVAAHAAGAFAYPVSSVGENDETMNKLYHVIQYGQQLGLALRLKLCICSLARSTIVLRAAFRVSFLLD